MTGYELLVLSHILAAIIWLGAGFTMDLLFLRAERTGDFQQVGITAALQDWLVPRLFIPASLATLVTGFLVTWDGPWGLGDLWVLIALAGWIVTFAVGFFFLRPQGERMKELVAEHGPASSVVARHARLLGVVARVQLLGLFLVAADMVLKPTTDDLGTLLLLAGILVAASVAGAMSVRRPVGGETASAR